MHSGSIGKENVMERWLDTINRMLWGNGLIALLLGTAVVCMRFGRGSITRSLRQLRSARGTGRSTHSLLQASTTSLAAAMGTGNLVGVATALTLGGPGALFWMWIAAACGMVLIYAENVLACHYRQEGLCGAMAYLHAGLHSPRLAAIFAICCSAAAFGMGNMTQSNAMAQTLGAAFRMPPLLTGMLAALLTGIVLLGGAQRIGRFTQAVIPLLSAAYLLAAGLVIWQFRENLGAVLRAVFEGAFGISAAAGGIGGAAMQRAVSVGVRRGVFSNEAGLGSSAVLHAEAETELPERLGLLGMAEVFLDTFVCCTVTALAILCSGVQGADGGVLLLEAFRSGLGSAADLLLPPMIALFALCTLIGWGCCGGRAFAYLTKGRHLRLYYAVFCMAAVLGAVMQLRVVWTLADIANACMAYCNLPAILLLYPAYTAAKRRGA